MNDLNAAWAEAGRTLSRKVQLNQRMVAAIQMERTRSALDAYVRGVAFEALFAVLGILLASAYFVTHVRTAALALPAAALDLLAIAILVDLVRQVAAACRIDYGQPVVDIQRRLESLRRMRIHHVRWVFIAATASGMPLLIVLACGLAGIDAGRLLHSRWFLANVLFGLAVVPLGWWISRLLAGRAGRSPTLQRIMRDLAGPHLGAAERFLGELAEFERG